MGPTTLEASQQANIQDTRPSLSCGQWCGRAVCKIVQCIFFPVWLLATIIIRVVVGIFRILFCCCLCSKSARMTVVEKWTPRQLSIEEARQEMRGNAQKARLQHRIEEERRIAQLGLPDRVEDLFASEEEIQNSKSDQTALTFSYKCAKDKGTRTEMEDAYCVKPMEGGVLGGVFDGHRGRNVAEYLSKQVPKRFKADENMHNAFEALVDGLHNSKPMTTKWKNQGSTAAICWIDLLRRILYVAAVGDAFVLIVRRIQGRLKIIPVSYNLNWTNEGEAHRAACVLKRDFIATSWPKRAEGKEWSQWAPQVLRFPDSFGLNVSRAIGDHTLCSSLGDKTEYSAGLSPEPKITECGILERDEVIIASDGLNLSAKQIIDIVGDDSCKDIAASLVNCAKRDPNLNDNVTVVAIKVTEAVH